ncbi:hypothetical protein P4O66_008093, partial [Electrophorus voltai]
KTMAAFNKNCKKPVPNVSPVAGRHASQHLHRAGEDSMMTGEGVAGRGQAPDENEEVMRTLLIHQERQRPGGRSR